MARSSGLEYAKHCAFLFKGQEGCIRQSPSGENRGSFEQILSMVVKIYLRFAKAGRNGHKYI